MTDYTSKKREEKVPVYSKVLSNGVFLHSISLENERTTLLVSNNGNKYKTEEYTDERTGITYGPAFDQYIKKQLVILPSDAKGSCEPEQLVEDVKNFIHKYIDLDEGFEEIVARYILVSYVCDVFEKIPYIRVVGLYGTGKSRFLDVVGSLIHLPIFLGGAVTPSNMYRMTDHVTTGSLLIDEANFEDSGKTSKITQVFNKGFQRGGKICRGSAKSYTPIPYDAFGPKVVAAHGVYSDLGLESRFFTHAMRTTKRSDMPLSLPSPTEWHQAELLRQRLLNYRLNYFHKIDIQQNVPQLSGFDLRVQEIARPLFQITPGCTLTNEVMAFLEGHEGALTDNNKVSTDGLVVTALFSLPRHDGTLVFLADVVEQVNQNSSYRLSSKRIGNILRVMGFKKWHTNRGIVIHLEPALMEDLASRFGIDKSQAYLEVCNG